MAFNGVIEVADLKTGLFKWTSLRAPKEVFEYDDGFTDSRHALTTELIMTENLDACSYYKAEYEAYLNRLPGAIQSGGESPIQEEVTLKNLPSVQAAIKDEYSSKSAYAGATFYVVSPYKLSKQLLPDLNKLRTKMGQRPTLNDSIALLTDLWTSLAL